MWHTPTHLQPSNRIAFDFPVDMISRNNAKSLIKLIEINEDTNNLQNFVLPEAFLLYVVYVRDLKYLVDLYNSGQLNVHSSFLLKILGQKVDSTFLFRSKRVNSGIEKMTSIYSSFVSNKF